MQGDLCMNTTNDKMTVINCMSVFKAEAMNTYVHNYNEIHKYHSAI